MFKNKLQLFAYDTYCDFNSTAANAVAGKDILVMIYNSDGTDLLAIAGQKGLTINRSADTIEVSSKDTEGGWKSNIAGMKEWSIDLDGVYVASDESHRVLSAAFEDSDPVCLKVVNNKLDTDLFGGLAYITDYPLEAPFDDAMTYSLTLSGNGALVDLSAMYASPNLVRIAKPSSGSNTAEVRILGATGTITGASEATGVSATISDGIATISVSSAAARGLATVTFTDSTSGTAQTCNVTVIIE